MDPVTLAIASTATSLIGTAFSTIGQRNAASAQAAIAQQNAKIAEENARRARFRSQVEAQDQDFSAAAQLGELAAAQSASGLSFGSRSFLQRRKSARELARKDALNIRQAGELEAFGFEIERRDALFERSQAKAAKSNALTSGLLEGAVTLIGGFSKVNKIKAGRIV